MKLKRGNLIVFLSFIVLIGAGGFLALANITFYLEKLPEKNEVFDFSFPPLRSDQFSIMSSVHIPYYRADVDSIAYRIFVYKPENGMKWHVYGIKTCDPKFKNMDGFSPGDITQGDIAEKLGLEDKLFGVEMSDGWIASRSTNSAYDGVETCFIRGARY